MMKVMKDGNAKFIHLFLAVQFSGFSRSSSLSHHTPFVSCSCRCCCFSSPMASLVDVQGTLLALSPPVPPMVPFSKSWTICQAVGSAERVVEAI